MAEARSPVLHDPSVVVPHAYNLILNPEHPDVAGIEIDDPEPIPIDPRLVN